MSDPVASVNAHAPRGVIPADLYDGLLGRPWRLRGRVEPGDGFSGVDCYGVVREVYRRRGVDLPDPAYASETDFRTAVESQRGAWIPLDEPEPGCVVLLDWGRTGRATHVGVWIGHTGGADLLHATEAGVTLTPLSAARMAGKVAGLYRYREAPAAPLRAPGREKPTDLTVVEYDPMGGERSIRRVPWQDGMTEGDFADGETARVVGGEVAPGAFLLVYRCASDPATLTSIAVSFAISLALTVLQLILAPSVPKPQDLDEPNGTAFDLAGLRNTAGVGGAQPVVYGERRVAGHIISAFQRANVNGQAVLHVLLLISRGPIHSIAGLESDQDELSGDDIPSDIEIDGNPASSYDVLVSTRLGSTDQDPIPGFRETVTTISYDRILFQNAPFVHSPTSRADALEVVFSFPLGLYDVNVSSGNLTPEPVLINISYRVQGTATWTTELVTIIRARRAPFVHMWRKEGLARDFYEVEIDRLTVWPNSQTDIESRSDLIEVHEITSDELSYPGKALIAYKAVSSDELTGAIPTFTSTIKGRKVWVWDGVSETAPDFGSTEVYSDVPAWCVLDMLTNTVYGGNKGGRLSLDNIDLASFLAWANHTETSVDDGRGGTVKRALLALAVDEIRGLWELANAVAHSHWGRLVLSGRKIKAIADKEETPVYAFHSGNAREWKTTYLGAKVRPNSVEVQYFNAEANFEPETATRLDEAAIFTNGAPEIKESSAAVGVTRPPQAYRLAKYRLNHGTLSKRRFSWVSGLESMHLNPFDVVWCNVPALKVDYSGRILAATSTTVSLDRAVVITSGTNKITCRTSSDTHEERTLTNGTYARNAAITITSAWTTTPVKGAPYVAGAESTYRTRVKITAIETVQETMERRFFGYEDPATLYDDDPGTVETFTDVMPDVRKIPAAVDNLHAEMMRYRSCDGSATDGIRITFDTDEAWHAADVWYRSEHPGDESNADDTAWRYAGRALRGEFEIAPVPCGATYRISVVPVSAAGTRRRAKYGAIATVCVSGVLAAPPAPDAVKAHTVNGQLFVCIDVPDDAPEIAGYEIRYGDSWAGSMRIGQATGAEFSMPAPFVNTQTVRVRSVTKDGVYSDTEVTASVTTVVPASTYDPSTTQNEHTGWTGTASGVTVDAGAIILTSPNLTGTYTGATITGLSTERRGIITIVGGLRDVALFWEEAGWTWDSEDADRDWQDLYLNGRELTPEDTWDTADQQWQSMPSDLTEWGGPTDVVAALTPAAAYDEGTGYVDFCPFEKTPTDETLSPRVTLNRPNDRYEPEVSEMTTSLYTDQGAPTP